MKDPTQKAHFYRSTLRDVLPFIPRVSFNPIFCFIEINRYNGNLEIMVATCVAVFATRDESGRGFSSRSTTSSGHGSRVNVNRVWKSHSSNIQVRKFQTNQICKPCYILISLIPKQNGLCIPQIHTSDRHAVRKPAHNFRENTERRYSNGCTSIII